MLTGTHGTCFWVVDGTGNDLGVEDIDFLLTVGSGGEGGGLDGLDNSDLLVGGVGRASGRGWGGDGDRDRWHLVVELELVELLTHAGRLGRHNGFDVLHLGELSWNVLLDVDFAQDGLC